jgi:hypothetical protein
VKRDQQSLQNQLALHMETFNLIESKLQHTFLKNLIENQIPTGVQQQSGQSPSARSNPAAV